MDVLVGKTAGFCNGITRAVNGCYEQLHTCQKVYCLGEIAHNKQVIDDLENKGMEFIDDLAEVIYYPAKVLIRAHGVKKEVYETAKNKNINLIDYTCPKVLAIHNIVEEYQKRGFYIFFTGENNHPEVVGTLSFCGSHVFLIETSLDIPKALEEFKKSGINQLLLISQTTFNLEKFKQIRYEIENLIPQNIHFVVQNTICMATQVRQAETRELSSKVDMMIIIGGKKSSNTQKLYEIALENCKNTIWIQTKLELEDISFDHIENIGIMAGASTPQNVIDEVVSFLKN